MFAVAHEQAQSSIAKYQFVSPGLLVSLSSPLTMGYRKNEFGLNQGFIEAVDLLSFLVISARIFLVVKPGSMLCFDSEVDLQK